MLRKIAMILMMTVVVLVTMTPIMIVPVVAGITGSLRPHDDTRYDDERSEGLERYDLGREL